VDFEPGLFPAVEGPGGRIGRYKLLQKLGEGGMGAVYMAEQEEPVRRRVALKLIKPGMDSAQVIARFEAERQALALMDHQNIARVLDAGAPPGGRPYFVMELVHGVPIATHCDENRLTLRECLELRKQQALETRPRFEAMSLLGRCLAVQGKLADAEPLLRQGTEGMRRLEDEVLVEDLDEDDVRLELAEAVEWLRSVENATAR
jgi:hypothetical protein